MIFDLHSHILPGLDDGAPDLQTSLEMVRLAYQSGTRLMVATPHANQKGQYENYCSPAVMDALTRLRRLLKAQGVKMILLPGMEIFASEDLVSLIRSRMLCPMAGTCYYLVEFPFDCPPQQMNWLFGEMLAQGYIPLIAHPERYYCVQDDPRWLAHWRQHGCYVQMNSASVFDSFGPISGAAARYILEMGLVDVLGSDAHGITRRSPDMRRTQDYLVRHFGPAYAKLLLQENPQALLLHKTLPREPNRQAAE